MEITNACELNEIEKYARKLLVLCDEILKTEKDTAKIKLAAKYKGEAYNNLGFIYNRQGLVSKALENYYWSLDISEQIKDSVGMADTYINLGSAFQQQEDHESAKKLFLKALDIYGKLDDKKGIAVICNNLGHLFQEEKDYKQSLLYHQQSIKLWKELDNKRYMAYALNNMGVCLDNIGQKDSALANYNMSIKIFEDLKSEEDIAWTCNLIGKLYIENKDLKIAEQYLLRGYKIANKLSLIEQKKELSQNLYFLFRRKKDYDKSLSYFIEYVNLKDSLKNDETKKIILTKQLTYQYEKQAAADSVKAAEAKKVMDAQIDTQKAQLNQEKTQRFALYGGVLVLIFFGGFMFNRFKVTQKQKAIIQTQKQEVEHQKELVEDINKEITDSIQYAKRIQNAILPPLKVVKEYLVESFILYKPKDIVAGDFYWLEYKEGKVLFAAADCTGHGVPGAMVSVICNNGLNRSVREYGLTDPGEILNKTREIVIAEFEKSEDEVKDGMDIALCSLRFDIQDSTLKNNKETLNLKPETTALLQYAGAHNPLWIIRKGELIETKANKQPIGKYHELLPYTTHTFELQKGDSIYIFSDGYVDQFGGEKGKKFKTAAFRTLLLAIQDNSMEEQQKIINTAFENWKGDLEQIDDVCVIGVRI